LNSTAEKKSATSGGERSKAAFSAVGTVFGGYEPGFELVDGMQTTATERFVVVSVGGIPRLLLPPEPPAMRAAIKSFLGNRQAVGLVPPLLKIASRLGGPFSKASSYASLISESGGSSPLRELLAKVLDRNDFQIALRLSFGRPNGKMVAVAISDAGEALCFAKFGSEAMTNDLVAHESEILEQFEGMDMPLLIPPRLYSGAWAGGHNALITAALYLEPLKRDASNAHRAAAALVLQTFISSSTLISSDYWHQIMKRVGKFEDSGNESDSLTANVAKIAKKWGDSNFDFGASHGDWTRANVGLVDGRVAALDWERCTKLAPRGIDIAHFALYEKPLFSRKKSVDIERVADNVREYLKAADLPPSDAESLIIFALLEEGLQKWAV